MGLFQSRGRVYKAMEDVDLGPNSGEEYIYANVKAPRLAGFVIKIFAWILESRIIGSIVMHILKADNLIHKLLTFAEMKEPPMYYPSYPSEDFDEQEVKHIPSGLSPCERVHQVVEAIPHSPSGIGQFTFKFHRWTILDYSRAYHSRTITPRNVAERLLAAIEDSMKPHLNMSFFISYNKEDILRQADESTSRHMRGQPLSVLDGVPIAVKDEIDCLPYPTTGGSKWLHKLRSCNDDACCVKHLRSCGALLVGKTNMHELGMGTSGINPHYGVTRNPYDSTKVSGGSSSGSAAVVSAGLCPVALGVDGGGSVRMPASLCGVIGFKPTFQRLSHSGVIPLNWTVGMVGILAGTVEDALIVYAAISGHLPSGQFISVPPEGKFPLLQSTHSVSNLKLAKCAKWFNDCNNDIRSCCDQALNQLVEHYKCKTVEVTLPEIEEMRLAHYVTISSECSASIRPYLQKLDVAEAGWDTRISCCFYRAFSSKEYLNAQRLRNNKLQTHVKIYLDVDFILSRSTGVTAYPIRNDALKYGELDYINGAALIRYQIAGNFLGLPAITVPIGYDKQGMPIGLQFIGRPWSEATLLHLAYAMQGLYSGSYQKPRVFYNLLSK
ncbi:fatty acid amide hydrolase isoform X2 [Amborella trichopoda]|uniref:fatty acid amide hydrolase isoform X2 n=2 Tax=Amborella trichopoda TaxID=13333 RepID=UPI0005D4021A|nr:fatty acid amide hydrolase isoform X2 [Amborella trichopoda]|eukprot:XP_011624340.1 fatty acid amide hydrolase isoform X2 [Amborella trichopoda]